MSRIGRLRPLAAAVVACAAAACHARTGEATPPGETVVQADTVVLTAAAPRATVPVDLARVAPAAEVAEVELARVENPAGVPFSVRLRLAWGADAAEAERAPGVVLGTLGAFPAEQGGRFVLGVADELRQARAALGAAPGTAAYMVLELVPIAPDRPLPASLRVHVAPVVFRGAR